MAAALKDHLAGRGRQQAERPVRRLLQSSGREVGRLWAMMVAVVMVKKAWIHEAPVRDELPRHDGD